MTRTSRWFTAIATAVLACAVAAPNAGAEALQWHNDLPAALEAARESGRPVLAEFHSAGCGPCVRMEQETLADPEVAALIAERFEPVRISALKQPDLATRYLVSFYPTVKFIGPQGRTVHDVQGFVHASDFLVVMEEAFAAHAALKRARAAAAGEVTEAAEMLAVARDFERARQHQQAADWAGRAAAAAENGSSTFAEAQYIVGLARVEAGRPADAKQPLLSALQHAEGAPWQWNARVKLGYVWLQLGEEDSGIGLLQSAHASEQAPADVKDEAAELLRWWGVEVD
jgi:thioredoxin-related protein